MKSIAYVSPFVPPEWIAAFGWSPRWLRLRAAAAREATAAHRGLCPWAGALVAQVCEDPELRAVVLATTCDPMRYAAAAIELQTDRPVFLLNVPSTWQSPAAGRLYREELVRLGRFLGELGGAAPSPAELTAVLGRFEAARASVRPRWPVGSGDRYAEAMAAVRSEGRPVAIDAQEEDGGEAVGLAILGGPLLEEDLVLFDMVRAAGGRIVLEGSEGGPRTLPAPFAPELVERDPIEALGRAYFDAIPDAFRRPNDRLFAWLRAGLVERNVQGIVLRRHVFCDLWHAELARVRQRSCLPVLDLDVMPTEPGASAAMQSRVEAFLETLRSVG